MMGALAENYELRQKKVNGSLRVATTLSGYSFPHTPAFWDILVSYLTNHPLHPMIPTNPELLDSIGSHEDIVEIRLDITRSAAYLISEEGYEVELQCDNVVELHQLGTLIQTMTEGSNVRVYWRGAVDSKGDEYPSVEHI